ncbi:MAG TPA: cell wall-binding protein [Clostridium sp.]|nr:cell wall-binding protein [Clostridium sp.]
MRFNRTTSLLICGAMVGGIVPLTAANASVKALETKDGLIYDAQAFANGMYIYDGRKADDSEAGTYFSTPKGDILIDDATGVGEKYGMNYINFKDDDILFNMMTGQAEDDSEDDKISRLENKFRHKVLDKVKRYNDVDDEDFNITEKLAVNCYSKIWYEAKAQDKDRDYTIYIDENGDYLDASEDLNIIYHDAKGNKVKLDTYEDLLDYNKENNAELSIPISKSLLVDGSNIYRAFVLVDNNRLKELTENVNMEIDSDVLENIDNRKLELLIGKGAITVYIQKISMEQGDKKDGAYLPKKVETYEANAILPTLKDFMAGEEVSARILDKNIYIVKPDTDNTEISYKKYKMTTVKDKVYGGSKKAVEEDEDFDEIKDEDMDDFSIDAHANLWVLSKGKIKKYANGELETVYKVDSSMDRLSVFDENSMIAWNTDDEIYSVLNTPTAAIDNSATEKAVPSENTSVETEAVVQTGWVKNEDGSWSYKNLDGTNALGWVNDNGNWYYLNNDGKMQTGWINDGGDWYYLNLSGEMKTGWHKDSNGKWYYLLESGKMAHDTVVNGYTIDSNGVWV